MPDTAPTDAIRVFTSTGEDLTPSTSSYLLKGENRAVLVDPGPDWHVERHLEELSSLIDPRAWLFAVILSPRPGSLSGLRILARIARRRAVVVHWLAASGADGILSQWQIRSPADEGGTIPLGTGSRLALVPIVGSSVPGSLFAFHARTRTLFSGAYFGSLGVGKTTGRPVLRRECVRAYADVFTPDVNAELVRDTFGEEFEISQIGPAHGKLTVGGRRLIGTTFESRPTLANFESAFYGLYLRIGALLGESAASGVFQAAGVPAPELEEGYHAGTEIDDPEAKWLTIYDRMQQWLTASAVSAIRPLFVRLTRVASLPVAPGLERFVNVRPVEPGPARNRQPDRDGSHEGLSQGKRDDLLTDGITGLANETAFTRRLSEILAPDATVSVSLLLIGVDNIERINRRYGRSGGDDALHTISYLLRNYRTAHPSARLHEAFKLSGPNFAYVASGTPLDEATGIAEEIRKIISESAMFLEQITVSIAAVASDEAVVDKESTVDSMVQVAQARLRVARSGGMNTVCATDPEGATALASGATVLIADPDAPYLETLSRQLNERGYSVLVADDGENALDIISQFVPDVIVCEAMLPKLNGFTIRERLRHSSRLSDIPYVLISHRKNDELVEKAALLGIVHFLRKPLSLVELTGLLRNLSGGYAE